MPSVHESKRPCSVGTCVESRHLSCIEKKSEVHARSPIHLCAPDKSTRLPNEPGIEPGVLSLERLKRMTCRFSGTSSKPP